jgi:hypothetical protein
VLGARLTRLASNAGVILGAMFPLAACAEIDHVALLNQARAKIVENIERLPKYTCLQTVHRSRFQMFPAVQVSSCGHVAISSSAKVRPQMMLAWTDRFKLEVTVSDGAEIFSWAGAQHFQSEDLEKIVGAGMTGTGDFGPFLISIFGGRGSQYDYLGLVQDKAQAFALYRYHVPVSASRYQFKAGSEPENLVTMAYDGKFWIDTQNAELSRMTIEVPHPPSGSQTCRIETTIDYRRARIGRSDFLLPQLTVLKVWDADAERHENRIEYASCREFQSESVFRTDLDASPGGSEISKSPVTIPPGITIKIALRSKIDSESSFAGDAIEGQLLNAIGTLVPKGALVHGRIVRFAQEYQPSNYYALGLKFHSIEVNGGEVPLALISVTRRKQIVAGEIEQRQGIGMFMFQKGQLSLDQKFVSEWKTVTQNQVPKKMTN